MAAAGLTDGHIASSRFAVIEFRRSLSGPLWSASCDDADRWLAELRRVGRSVATRAGEAGTLAQFYDFVINRYQGDIHALTGCVVEQPIDAFNRQSGASLGRVRVPPSDVDVEHLFGQWRGSVSQARKYLPAARDYFAASLWRRLGLRINETRMLDIRDWRPDLGAFGKLHVRHGKGSRGRGPKARLVPAINGADQLIDWWLAEVRHQYGSDWADPDAPMLPSERRDPDLNHCGRVGDDSLRRSLRGADRSLVAGLVGTADAARAAAPLRVLALWQRDGPQGAAGPARSRLAVHDHPLRPRPRRPRRAVLAALEPASGEPIQRKGLRPCAGICG